MVLCGKEFKMTWFWALTFETMMNPVTHLLTRVNSRDGSASITVYLTIRLIVREGGLRVNPCSLTTSIYKKIDPFFPWNTIPF